MNLDYQTILTRANSLYKEAKREKYPLYYNTDDDFEIKSDQVKSILKDLIEELNAQKLELNPLQNKPQIDTFVEDRQPAGYF